jgi:hypothetical protein
LIFLLLNFFITILPRPDGVGNFLAYLIIFVKFNPKCEEIAQVIKKLLIKFLLIVLVSIL